ncbi:MAG: hypothetical protein ACI9YL_001276 [Luteibaculaceae bacterium]|jgi:hypothetical protein
MKNCLLIGRKGIILQEIQDSVDTKEITFFGGTKLTDVRDIIDQENIDCVIMGAGVNLDVRINIIRYVMENSKGTTVHMKDWKSGPTGMLPFVLGVLNSLKLEKE